MNHPNTEYAFRQIGVVHSCFKEKFGIPRQPGLAPDTRAELELLPPYNRSEAVRGLARFSHVWILFVFHAASLGNTGKITVRPPRLGGNQRVGVFATRSGFRPNPIGQSVVRLKSILQKKSRLFLLLDGVDLLDDTPVLDIKPYLPYADAVSSASDGFAPDPRPQARQVRFSPSSATACRRYETSRRPALARLITQILQQDPRPAYYRSAPRKQHFGMRLYNLEIHWRWESRTAVVLDVKPARENSSATPMKRP